MEAIDARSRAPAQPQAQVMPEETPGMGVPPQPGAPSPVPTPQAAPGQATGISPATTPAPNRGLEAAALAKLAVYVQGMSVLLAVLPAGSDIARDVREAINKIAKHVPPGAVSQGIQMTEAQKNLMQQRQAGPQVAAMRAAQMQHMTPQQQQAA